MGHELFIWPMEKLTAMKDCALLIQAWEWAKGITAPIVGATKAQYLDDAVATIDIELTPDEVKYLEEPYTAHEIVGALNENPVGMLPKDVK